MPTDLDGVAGGKTSNPTLRLWIPTEENVDDLLSITSDKKTKTDLFPLCVAYQTGAGERTFENTLKNENKELTKDVKGDKAAFALNLLALEKFDDNAAGLKTPKYIEEGLIWLDGILQKKLEQKPLTENVGDKNA
jgi:hypothetical protein